jgi:excisionase family DNA binding protein
MHDDIPDRLADPIADAAKRLGISRATAYLEINAGRLRTYTTGKRRMVSREAQHEYIRAREAAAADADHAA